MTQKKTSKPATALRFTPYAWAKLLFMRDMGESEVGGFGVCDAADLLLIRDFITVKQTTDIVSVRFDDTAVADYFETMVEAGRRPDQFARMWIHTHPGDCPKPSSVDEETFERVFGKCDWALMFILARNGDTFARIRFSVGPGVHGHVPVDVDYDCDFPASDRTAWQKEYEGNVCVEDFRIPIRQRWWEEMAGEDMVGGRSIAVREGGDDDRPE